MPTSNYVIFATLNTTRLSVRTTSLPCISLYGHRSCPWYPLQVCFSLTATMSATLSAWVYTDKRCRCTRPMILPWWKPPMGSLTRSRCALRSYFASSVSPPRIKARCYNDYVVQVNHHPSNVIFQETVVLVPGTVLSRSTLRVSASKRGMEHSEHSSEFEEAHARDVQPSGRFFCCYLLVSLNPARKGRTYIG